MRHFVFSICKIAISDALDNVNFDKAAVDAAVTKIKLGGKRQRKSQSTSQTGANRMERDRSFLQTLSLNSALKDPSTIAESTTLMFKNDQYLNYRSVLALIIATFLAIIMQSNHAIILRRESSRTTGQLNDMIASGLHFLLDREKFWEETKTK